MVICFLSFTILDDFETANRFLQNSNKFMNKTPKETVANAMISKFETLSDKLYKNDINKFLSDCVHDNLETFYSHVLRWYLPEIIKKDHSKYKI